MGLISRQGTAPIQTGDPLDAAEVEAEFNTIFTVINGNLEDANVKALAGIAGTKIADNTIANAKILADSLTTAKMAASAVPKADVDTDTGIESLTTSATFVDVPGLSTLTLVPGSNSDMILVDLTISAFASVAGTWVFGCSIAGSDHGPLAQLSLAAGFTGSVSFSFALVAGTTSSKAIKARYYRASGSGTGQFTVLGGVGTTKILRAIILPIK